MKRFCILALAILSLNTGCIFGRSNSGRPGFFSSLHNRIHGTSVGAPCASGSCGQPAPFAAPMMQQALNGPDCVGCETAQLGYPEYPMTEGSVTEGETIYEGNAYLGETVSPAPMQPIQGRGN